MSRDVYNYSTLEPPAIQKVRIPTQCTSESVDFAGTHVSIFAVPTGTSMAFGVLW